MSVTEQQVQVYRTNDMAMTTFLKTEGFTVQQVLWDQDTCYWIFLMTETLMDCISQFEKGMARVEPKTWSRHFTQTKKEFYSSKDRRRSGR